MAILCTLVHGMVMSHHLMVDVTLGDLEAGLPALGDAVTHEAPPRPGMQVDPGTSGTLVPAAAGR